MHYTCKKCGRRYEYNSDVGYSRDNICGPFCDGILRGEEKSAARIKALEEVVRELLCRGESLSFYYASSHGKGCGCVPCGRLSNWEESVIKALELLNREGK